MESTLGISKPLFVAEISNCAFGLGEAVPIPIFCEKEKLVEMAKNKVSNNFIAVILLVWVINKVG